MITFKSLNINGDIKTWGFRDRDQLRRDWNLGINCPSNDDPIWDIKENGRKYLSVEATYKKVISGDPVCFGNYMDRITAVFAGQT